jgi:FkbM family methyltransferase
VSSVTSRPEDRKGIQPGSQLARMNSALFKSIAWAAHKLPNFRGKIRAADTALRILGLENQHILKEASIDNPAHYHALLDFHSRHERWAYLMNGYESGTTRFLSRLFDGMGCFVDVGANIGLIAIPFSRLVAHRDGVVPEVYCIEAIAANAERLKHNIAINGLAEKVRSIESGIGDEEKVVEIQVEGNLKEQEGTGTANILADDTDHPCERIPLAITTLDNLIKHGSVPEQVSLIKIDVDGYDLKVLQGAENLLDKSRPIIFGEFMEYCLAWHGQSYTDVIAFVAPLGYRVFRRTNDGFVFSDKDFNGFQSDLLIVPEEKVETVQWCVG